MDNNNNPICTLCKTNTANKKGSHIIPHFLIQSIFSMDDRNSRYREAILTVGLSENIHIGRELNIDKIEEIFGRQMNDEDIQNNPPNPFVRDYIYCNECENKFGVIESVYAQSTQTQFPKFGNWQSSLAPHLTHIFWISVLWRLSSAKFGFAFPNDMEEKLRRILVNTLALNQKNIPDKGYYIEQLQNYGYYLMRFHDSDIDKTLHMGVSFPVQGEDTYADIFSINNFVLYFYRKANKSCYVNALYKITGINYALERDLNSTNFNNCIKNEVIVNFNSLAHECISSVQLIRQKRLLVYFIQQKEKIKNNINCSEENAIKILNNMYPALNMYISPIQQKTFHSSK